MPGMEDTLGVPAEGNPSRSSDNVVPVLGGAQGMFEGAVPVRDVLYDIEQGPRVIDNEPTFEERVLANQQMEASRLSKIRELGFDVSETKPFEYADAKPVFDPSQTLTEAELAEVLDYAEDVVDENGDIVDDEEFGVDSDAFPDAIQVPSEPPKNRGGRPRKQ